jgi:hypothetical protein
MPRLATGLERQALLLEEFMRFYKPKGWICPISDVDFIPYISNNDIQVIMNGEIPTDEKFDKWYIKDAIKEWLAQQ